MSEVEGKYSMSRLRLKAVIPVITLGLCLLPGRASAAAITGTFGIDGYIVVTDTTMTFFLNQGGPANEATIFSASTNYMPFLGDVIGIQPLDISTETVGGGTYSVPFITIPMAVPVEQLNITNIAAGVDPSTDCTLAPAVGQTCTPNIPGGSPFNLANITDSTPGQGGISTNFDASFGGTVAGSTDVWSGTFSGTVDGESFQQLIAQAGSAGGAATTYSGTFEVTVSAATPEPSTLPLMCGGGLFLLAGFFIRKRSLPE